MLGKGLKIAGSLALLGSLAACSSSSGDSPAGGGSTALTLSGKLALESSGAVSKPSKGGVAKASGNTSLAASDYAVSCSTFEVPPLSCGSPVSGDGSFTITCSGFATKPFGCFVYNTTTFTNYPVVFNVSDSSKNTIAGSGGSTVSVEIALDTETGTAAAAVKTPTVVADNSSTLTATQLEAVVDGTYQISALSAALTEARLSDLEKTKLLNTVFCVKNDGTEAWPKTSDCPTNGYEEEKPATVARGAELLTINVPNFPIMLDIFQRDNKPMLALWENPAAKNSCGDISNPSWKFSDGAGGAADVALALTGADSEALATSIDTAMASVISNWFGILSHDASGGGGTIDADNITCKYVGDVDWQYFNHTPEQMSACEANNSCNSGWGDTFNKLHRYKNILLYNGFSGTDPIVGAVNLTGKMIADNVTLKYGVATGWNENGPIMEERSGTPVDLELGGCVSWTEGVATITPVGQYYTYWMNGTAVKEKCRYSERRLLFADANGMFTINGQKYTEAQRFIEVDGAKKQVWQKICGVDTDGDGAGTDLEINPYPPEMPKYDANPSVHTIAKMFNDRQSGGSVEDRKSRDYQAIYQLLTGGSHDGVTADGIADDVSFHFWNQQSQNQGSITCGELAGVDSPDIATLDARWAKVEALFNSYDSYQQAKAMSCILAGIGNGKYLDGTNDNVPKSSGDGMDAYVDDDGDNVPNMIENLIANSCIPRFQVARICKDGSCNTKVVCSSTALANGGCDKANPAGADILNVEQLAAGRYLFGSITEQYDFHFDPNSNTSKTCTRSKMFQLANEEAFASATTDYTLRVTQSEAKVCEGEAPQRQEPTIMYVKAVKQP